MLKHIVSKEVKETVRDGRFRWGATLVGALLVLALAAGWSQRNEIARSHAAAAEQSREHWLEQGEKNPHSAAHYGVYVFKPVSSLALLDRGVDPYMGVSTWLEAHYQNPFANRAVQDTPALARFGDFTAATTLQLLLPLLIFLMAFQAFSGERESGTLRQVMSIGVRPERLAAGKAVGILAALALLLVPAAIIGALALVLSGPGGEAVQGEFARFALLATGYLAYFLMFVLLALAVSAWTKSSRTALAVLIVFWIANGLVAPRLASDIARALEPLPTAAEFQATVQQELREGFGPHPDQDTRRQMLQDSVLAAHGVESVDQLPFNYGGFSLQQGEEYASLVWDRNFGALAERIREQEQLHRRLSFLAPHLAIRSLSMALTATDPAHHQRFAEAAEQHRRLMQRLLNGDLMEHGVYGETYLVGRELWERTPDFEYQGPGVDFALAGQGPAGAALLFWLLLGAILTRRGVTALRREV